MKKIIAFLVCAAMLVVAFPVVTSAAGGVSTYANNVNACNAYFNINEYGHASIVIDYVGYDGITTGATITVQMQKKFLGLFGVMLRENTGNILAVKSIIAIKTSYSFPIRVNTVLL